MDSRRNVLPKAGYGKFRGFYKRRCMRSETQVGSDHFAAPQVSEIEIGFVLDFT